MISNGPSAKLRLSCDECLQSKIKCDKQKPKCNRCRGLGRDCVYGVSRKVGRPPSATRAKGRENLANSTTPTRTTLIAPKDASNLDPAPPSSSETWQCTSTNSGSDLGVFNEWDEFSIEGIDPFELLNGWNEVTEHEDGHDHAVPAESQSCRMSTATPEYANSDSDLVAPTAIMVIEQNGRCQFGTGSAPWTAPIGGCDSAAYSILGNLNCVTQQNEPLDARSGGIPSEDYETTILRLDNILQRSKNAVSSVTGLLDCSCAQEPRLAMLYTSIVSKILSWYQVAANHLPSAESPQCASQATSQSSSSCFAKPASLHNSSACIRFGSFQVDAIDQAAFHRQLLLVEIGKVDVLLDKMLLTFRQNSQPEVSTSSPASWYESSCRTIRTKLQEIKDSVAHRSIYASEASSGLIEDAIEMDLCDDTTKT